MKKDIAVIVKENPIHIVEVRNGVIGKRGPKGDTGTGLKGDKGDTGEKGDEPRPVKIVETAASSISISLEDHGSAFFTYSNSGETISVTILLETEEKEKYGEVLFFTQMTDKPVNIITPVGVELILPTTRLAQTYEKGSTIGLVAKKHNCWLLVGDMAFSEIRVE